MTISVPTDLRERMQQHEHVNWSRVAVGAFEKRLRCIEQPTHEVHSLIYAIEKLDNAVSTLCSSGSIQTRLTAALVYNLIHVPVHALPERIRRDFQETMNACTKHKGSGPETIARMADDEAAKHSEVVLGALWHARQRLHELRD